MTPTAALSRLVILSLVVFGMGGMLSGCGQTRFEAVVSAQSSTSATTLTTDHTAAVAKTMGPPGSGLRPRT